MNDTFNLTTIPNFMPTRDNQVRYVEYTQHLFSPTEIFIVLALFIFLSYWYIKVNRDKEKYQHWINPNGREVNLYKTIRICFWAYTGIVVVFGIISILLAR